MNYPSDFDTPAFPAGKSVAWARMASIKISIVFFLIFCACGLMLFAVRAKKNFPFLISVDPLTDRWTVVAYPQKKYEKSIEQYQIIQEKVVTDFVTNWFTISRNKSENYARWKECANPDCALPGQYNPQNIECALFCSANPELFKQFSTKVLPEYTARIDQASETWTVIKRNITPHYVTPNASAWQVYIDVQSSVSGRFNVLIFMKIGRDTESYPATLGYYVKDFNSYRVKS